MSGGDIRHPDENRRLQQATALAVVFPWRMGTVADVTKRFRETLERLCAEGKRSGMRLTVQKIEKELESEHLSLEKLQLIYNYLDQMAIEIYDPTFEEKPSSGGERKQALELYLEELDRFVPLPEDVELLLFDKAADGDKEAADTLIERYLSTACDLAGEFENSHSKVDPEDLVQEANIGLVLAMSEMKKEKSLAAYRVKLLNYVTDYLEESVKNLEEMMNADTKVVNRMNKLADAVHELEENLGHKPSVEEMSAFLDLPEEDIRDLLRVGGENLKIDEI